MHPDPQSIEANTGTNTHVKSYKLTHRICSTDALGRCGQVHVARACACIQTRSPPKIRPCADDSNAGQVGAAEAAEAAEAAAAVSV